MTGHNGRDHGTIEVDDPKNKGEKKKVCAKFPTMTCDVHEQMRARLEEFAKLEFQYLPFTAVVDPNTKAVIDSFTGDWSMSQIQKKWATVEKAMSGPRVSAAEYGKYKKALELKEQEKYKEAQALIAGLLQKKLPPKFEELLKKEQSELQEKAGK